MGLKRDLLQMDAGDMAHRQECEVVPSLCKIAVRDTYIYVSAIDTIILVQDSCAALPFEYLANR